MLVQIQFLTGDIRRYIVSRYDTISHVKRIIQREEGIPTTSQHLIWRNSELADHTTMAEAGVSEESILKLVISMTGGPVCLRYFPVPVSPSSISGAFTPPPAEERNLISTPSSSSCCHDVEQGNSTFDSKENTSDELLQDQSLQVEHHQSRIENYAKVFSEISKGTQDHFSGGEEFLTDPPNSPGSVAIIMFELDGSVHLLQPFDRLPPVFSTSFSGIKSVETPLSEGINKDDCVDVDSSSDCERARLEQKLSILRLKMDGNRLNKQISGKVKALDLDHSPVHKSLSLGTALPSIKMSRKNNSKNSTIDLPPLRIPQCNSSVDRIPSRKLALSRTQTAGNLSLRTQAVPSIKKVSSQRSDDDKNVRSHSKSIHFWPKFEKKSPITLPPLQEELVQTKVTLNPGTSKTFKIEEPLSPPKRNRCYTCRKRIGPATTFHCRCQRDFCATHRYPEEHVCVNSSFREEAKIKLCKENPLTIARKVADI